MNSSPLAFTRSSSASFSSSLPFRRNTTSENRCGATSSHAGSASTHPAKRSASRMCSRRIRCNPSRPKQRSTAQSFSERKRRPSAGPYSESAYTSSDVRRYSGTRLNACRKSSGREVQSSEQFSEDSRLRGAHGEVREEPRVLPVRERGEDEVVEVAQDVGERLGALRR